MKKRMLTITAVILTCLMLLSVTACNNNNGNADSSGSSDISSSSEISSGDMSSLDDTSSDTSSTLEGTTVEVDANDKAYVKNPAKLLNPMTSKFDKQADAMRSNVLNAKDTLPKTVTGKIWYISNSGSDANSGNSKDDAWASIDALNYYGDRINEGDAVLFERGGVYRGTFYAESGVYYGAYGEGDKPCIYGSSQNYAKVNWKNKHGNIWICDTYFTDDVGTIVFNHGESVGYKRYENFEMKNNGDFWCDQANGYTLYMYMDKNPADVFKSIEIGVKGNIITMRSGSKNITIENLCLKYTGAHAIQAGNGSSNITVRNCEIGFVGGSYLNNPKYDKETRYGNGIEFFQGCENIRVENNWIYQIYDSGITHQGDGNYVAKNLTFSKNLIEYCGMGSIEYWLWYDKSVEGQYNSAENVTYADNIMRFAGYCWGGEQRPDKVSAHILSETGWGSNTNTVKNFKITGNILDQSSCDLLVIASKDGTYPTLSGNTYAQNSGGSLGAYAESKDIYFDDNVGSAVNAIDKTGKVYYY